ncbi:MAG TPA: cyclic nucleotide-binding and patatin-like phospholipase domain-containing protein [Casimicrobiaceae bacterium]|nr:cyclic nucleotide-binding and patatin-like phospholipase domain-containing protein [Casimicrobiaceae bacterium]
MTAAQMSGRPASLPADLAAILSSRELRSVLPPTLLSRIGGVLEPVTVERGATVILQGDHGDELYVVLQGLLSVLVERPDGTVTQVDEVGPADVVGEMALLTRQPRTATVVAKERSTLVKLSREAFDEIIADDPQAMHAFARRVLHRLRRTQLVKVLSDVLGEMDDHAVRELERSVEWLHVASGSQVFGEHEAAHDIYVVVNGRLRITTANAEGEVVTVHEVGHGSMVGQVAVLSGGLHDCRAEAIRDSHLLRLPRAALDPLVQRHPKLMVRFAQAAIRSVQRTATQTAAMNHPRTYALVSSSPEVSLDLFAMQLTRALDAHSSTRLLSSADVDRALLNAGVAQARDGTVASEALTAWLSNQERDHAAIVLQADSTWTAWTRRCVLHADRIVIVASAAASPVPTAVERELRALQSHRRTELVLLHAAATARPSGTGAWLEHRQVAAHHHVRSGCDTDVARVARHLSGRAIGLVLGGGGARGFAHVGVLRALREAGVEIDVVGGTSIGALIAACIASDLRVEDIDELGRTFASPRRLLDRTLPIAALMAGAKVTALYQRVFSDIAIEDLWTPYFAVSSDLSRAMAVVHQRGAVWRAVRASTAIPAIFPPLLGDDDQVHVDGGVMNNMPIDVMRHFCRAGTVIAVNPMPPRDHVKSYRFGPSLSGWQALAGRLRMFGSKVRAPSILGSVMRATEINSAHRMRQPAFRALADVLIEPALAQFPILAFDRYGEIAQVGYEAAKEAIASWQARDAQDEPREALRSAAA